MTKNKTKTNLQRAYDLLRGKSVVAHDRRSGDAIAIDYERKQMGSGKCALRPSYGISNTLHKALKSLAKEVRYDDRSMPLYIFDIK